MCIRDRYRVSTEKSVYRESRMVKGFRKFGFTYRKIVYTVRKHGINATYLLFENGQNSRNSTLKLVKYVTELVSNDKLTACINSS